MLDKDSVLFDDVSLSDILKKIYNNSDSKQKQIDDMVDKLGNLVKGVTDASILLPLLKEIMDVSIKNDEQLVKMAGIIQRLLQVDNNPKGNGGMDLLPDHEKMALLQNIKEGVDSKKVDEQLEQLAEKVKQAKEIIKKEDNKLLIQVASDVKK